MLIHSPLVGPTTWSEVAHELQRRGRRAVVPSLLGVAEAPTPQWRHVPEAVHDALSQVADLVLLTGHSGAAYGESATRARNLGWPVAEVPDGHHLTIGTDPVDVSDALLALERALVVAE